jgi:hypothetical protein
MARHLLLLSFPRHSSAPAAPLLQIHGAQHLERPCLCSSTGISSSTRRPGLSHHGCPSSISSLPTRLPRFHGRRRPQPSPWWPTSPLPQPQLPLRPCCCKHSASLMAHGTRPAPFYWWLSHLSGARQNDHEEFCIVCSPICNTVDPRRGPVLALSF